MSGVKSRTLKGRADNPLKRGCRLFLYGSLRRPRQRRPPRYLPAKSQHLRTELLAAYPEKP